MTTFSITTLGCKVNQCESAAVSECLKKYGWASNSIKNPSEVYIINTCTVTHKAAMQSRQAVRRAIRTNPNAHIVVTGCYAQTEMAELSKIKGIDLIVGHADKYRIPDILQDLLPQKRRSPLTICRDVRHLDDFEHPPATAVADRTRPSLKIQDGCDAFCTYCIVPYARGPSRSMPFQTVLEHIRRLKDSGYHEVVLSGIHLGNYGQDLSPASDLFSLLKELNNANIIDRLRLSSIEPYEISDEIIELAAHSSIICPHFHVPLQSGDDSILEKMHRPYTRNYFRDRILKIHERMPSAAIGTDILVGFPGETHNAFDNTVRLIDELPVSYLHVFPFSARKGTPASNYSGKVAVKEIKSRCRQLRHLDRKKRLAFYRKNKDRCFEVLIESRRERLTGHLQGFTQNYIPVLLQGDDQLKNTIVRIKTAKITDSGHVFATLIR